MPRWLRLHRSPEGGGGCMCARGAGSGAPAPEATPPRRVGRAWPAERRRASSYGRASRPVGRWRRSSTWPKAAAPAAPGRVRCLSRTPAPAPRECARHSCGRRRPASLRRGGRCTARQACFGFRTGGPSGPCGSSSIGSPRATRRASTGATRCTRKQCREQRRCGAASARESRPRALPGPPAAARRAGTPRCVEGCPAPPVSAAPGKSPPRCPPTGDRRPQAQCRRTYAQPMPREMSRSCALLERAATSLYDPRQRCTREAGSRRCAPSS
mmetsp:Transcript_30940/g.98814  ORF Transcript_30940/g.98814 Transcript_30940/m.98814 type:complete len:270 (+) Transcript_30940:201-1010(+)|eukprot:scaffold7602_cov123-Isochrysis_galbana.AAC.3